MRRNARVDSNQPEIVKTLRQMGATVYPTHMVGRGFPDLVVGFRGKNYLVEIKDGNKPPSAKALTADEQLFFDTWKGSVFIVESIECCISLLSAGRTSQQESALNELAEISQRNNMGY